MNFASSDKASLTYCARTYRFKCSFLSGCRCKPDKIFKMVALDADGGSMRLLEPRNFYLC